MNIVKNWNAVIVAKNKQQQSTANLIKKSYKEGTKRI